MENIIDYVKKSEDLFCERALTQVDSLVFSELAYMRYEACGMEQREKWSFYEILAEAPLESMTEEVLEQKKCIELLRAVQVSRRYRNARITNYVNHFDTQEEKQFAAITFLLDDGSIYVAFRGTDSTTVGWKEDFNLAFMPQIPSQIESVAYLEKTARWKRGTIYVGGHSKGGNLAVYAAVMAKNGIQKRIRCAFSHDGPGFTMKFLQSEQFEQMESRICKTVPKQSVIGMLLENHEEYVVVESSSLGIMQHNPYTWMIKENDFVTSERLARSSEFLKLRIHTWLEKMTKEQREEFVNALFSTLELCGIEKFSGKSSKSIRDIPSIIKSLNLVDAQTKKVIFETVKMLFLVPVPKKTDIV